MYLLNQSIFAIDPGSHVSGYACIRSKLEQPLLPSDMELRGLGVVRLKSSDSKSQRLKHLHQAYKELFAEFSPDVIVVESAFYGVNARTALVLGEARGAILAAAEAHLPIFELSPAEIKKTIMGNGRASKESLSVLLSQHFALPKVAYDATDALGAALSYALDRRQR